MPELERSVIQLKHHAQMTDDQHENGLRERGSDGHVASVGDSPVVTSDDDGGESHED